MKIHIFNIIPPKILLIGKFRHDLTDFIMMIQSDSKKSEADMKF